MTKVIQFRELVVVIHTMTFTMILRKTLIFLKKLMLCSQLCGR
jgi:hypothetical protein